jgi:hypothetical protein
MFAPSLALEEKCLQPVKKCSRPAEKCLRPKNGAEEKKKLEIKNSRKQLNDYNFQRSEQ